MVERNQVVLENVHRRCLLVHNNTQPRQTTHVILAPVDFLLAVAYSLAITVILAGGLVICIVCNIPFLDKAYAWYAKRHGGVTFINIGKTYIAKLRLSLTDMDSSE
jgi:hypothetical protein